MRVRTYKLEIDRKNTVKPLENPTDSDKGSGSRKFNTSMERRIERIWFEAKRLGWTYNHFVVCLLESLIVLQQREKVRLDVDLAARHKRQ
jgi:hypothetical protein